MYTLGINAAFHDCSACLVADGMVIAAAEEERFTRVKHGKRPLPFTVWQLPFHTIDYCLQEAGIDMRQVSHVAYSYDPFMQLGEVSGRTSISLPLEPSSQASEWLSPWDPLALSYIVNAPRQLRDGAPHYLQQRFCSDNNNVSDVPYQWHFVDHHLAHEASAFLSAPFDECAVLVMDGRGERATTSYGVYRDGKYQRLKQVNLPHSLGLMYEDITDHLGFLRSSDEYKVMALASFGKPVFVSQLREILCYHGGGDYTVASVKWKELFGPARKRGGPLEQKHRDIAHSMQVVLEETAANMVHWLYRETGTTDLCMAGGVALNCVMNAKLRDHGPFSQVWIQPAAGDSGTALGAALWVDAQEHKDKRNHKSRWKMEHVFLGPSYNDDEIEQFLLQAKLPYRRANNIALETAALLAQNKVVGWFQGRMEYGPRSLGARSILASPIDPSMQSRLNQIKDREDFRPVAPVVLEEEVENWFVDGGVSPFMVFVYDVRPGKASQIPAVRHIDGTARVQTINRSQHALYYDLLHAFAARTGVPVLVNTSFNTRGEPIVCSPRDALESFCSTPLDVLAIGSFLLEKSSLMIGSVSSLKQGVQ